MELEKNGELRDKNKVDSRLRGNDNKGRPETDNGSDLDSGRSLTCTEIRSQNDTEERPDETKPENDTDLPPEYCHYHDEGCELAHSCLNCPFARCIYDEPGGKQRWLKRRRAKEIARLHTMEGKKVGELAEMFGVSQRTVQRALKTGRGSSNGACHAGTK